MLVLCRPYCYCHLEAYKLYLSLKKGTKLRDGSIYFHVPVLPAWFVVIMMFVNKGYSDIFIYVKMLQTRLFTENASRGSGTEDQEGN